MASQADSAHSTDMNDTKKAVYEICDELYRQTGVEPSIRTVKKSLANEKSISTVHAYYKEWFKREQDKRQALFDKLGFSEAFVESFMKEINRFAANNDEHHKRIAEATNEQHQAALDDLAALDEKYLAKVDEVEQLKAQISSVQNDIEEQAEEHENKTQSLEQANAAAVSELRTQIIEQAATNDTLQKQNDNLHRELSRAELKAESAEQLVREAREEKSRLTEENTKTSETLRDLYRKVDSQESTIKGNDALIASLRDSLADSRDNTKSAHSQAEQLRSEKAKSDQQFADIEARLTLSQDNLEKANAVIEKLERQVSEQSSVITRLTKEN